jgi:hypothetical protein
MTEDMHIGLLFTNQVEMDGYVTRMGERNACRAIALMMEAARTSETLANFYQTTRRYNPEDSHLRTHRRENLKSYFYRFDL